MARGGKAELDVVLKGDSKSAQAAIKDTGAALGKLSTLSSKASGEIEKAFGGTKLGAVASKATSLFEGVGKSAAQTGLLIGAGVAGGVTAAGVAIGKFALDGVGAFQRTALAAGKFSDATGLSVQSASKYLEVSHDLGISADTFQSAFVKMEKALSSNRAAFGDLVATTSSGAVDLNQTFLNVITHIQGIKDPLDRAKESAQLFGRGFADVAEVINTSADDITQRLASVREQQIISPQELDQARQYRDAMNELGDSFEALQIAAGQKLIPGLAHLAETGANLLDIFNRLTTKDYGSAVAAKDNADAQTAQEQALNDRLQASKNLLNVQDDEASKTRHLIEIQNDYSGSSKAVTDALKAEQQAMQNLAKAADDLLGTTTNVDRAQQDFTDKMQALGAAQLKAAKGGKDHVANLRDLRLAIDDAKDSAQSLAQANLKQAEAQAASIGKTLTAEQQNKVLADTYRKLAGTAKGPVADALRGTAFLLDAVGAKHPKPTIDANPKPAKVNINDVQRLSDSYDKMRFTSDLDANKAPAEDALTALKRALANYDKLHPEATLGVKDEASGTIASVNRALRAIDQTVANAVIHVTTTGTHIAPGTTVPHLAAGGPVAANKAYIVGDGGQPELFVPNQNGRVIPQVTAMTPAGSSGGPVYHLHFDLRNSVGVDQVAMGRTVKQALAAADRAGVR